MLWFLLTYLHAFFVQYLSACNAMARFCHLALLFKLLFSYICTYAFNNCFYPKRLSNEQVSNYILTKNAQAFFVPYLVTCNAIVGFLIKTSTVLFYLSILFCISLLLLCSNLFYYIYAFSRCFIQSNLQNVLYQ